MKKFIYPLFVFVFLLGLVSCNQGSPPMFDATENSSEKQKKHKSTVRCDWCREPIQGRPVWASINRNYRNISVKCCSNKCKAANERANPFQKKKQKFF